MTFKTLCGLAAVAQSVQVHVLQIGENSFQAVIQPSLELAKEYPQLASPLMVQSTAELMDEEVNKALTEFTPELKSAVSNITSVKESLAAATKAAQEELAKKNAAKAKPGVSAKTVPPAAGTTTSVSKATQLVTVKPTPSAPPDLFGEIPEITSSAGQLPAGTGELDEIEFDPLEE